MSGTINQLFRPLAIEQPDPQQVSLADAWTANTRMLGDYLAQQQAEAQQRGLWTGGQVWEGGHPTAAGATDAANQYAQGVLMGTTAPGSPGFTAYHGSPHDFSAFDTSKIGTGEGAQAYGHGLYFAENEGIAKGYRDRLTQPDKPADDLNSMLTTFAPYNPNGPAITADNLRAAMAAHGSPGLAKAAGDDALIRDIQTMTGGHDLSTGTYSDAAVAAASRLDTSLAALPGKGHMYEVNIAADPAHFLDWDRPLSEQPAVVAKLNAAGIPVGKDMSRTGADLHDTVLHYDTGVDKAGRPDAAELATRLRDAGIPGIKYLDAGSRSAGEGSRNHVVFDANSIDILRKYGIAGLIAGGLGAGSVGAGTSDQ